MEHRIIDDGVNEWYTVIGIVPETMERWAESFHVDTALAAEEAAVRLLESQGGHIMVAGVVRWKINIDVDVADKYATYVDPQATSFEQMKALMEEWNLWKFGEWHNEEKPKEKKGWFR